MVQSQSCKRLTRGKDHTVQYRDVFTVSWSARWGKAPQGSEHLGTFEAQSSTKRLSTDSLDTKILAAHSGFPIRAGNVTRTRGGQPALRPCDTDLSSMQHGSLMAIHRLLTQPEALLQIHVSGR